MHPEEQSYIVKRELLTALVRQLSDTSSSLLTRMIASHRSMHSQQPCCRCSSSDADKLRYLPRSEMPDSPQAFLSVDLHLKMNISVSQREVAELHAAGMQAAVVAAYLVWSGCLPWLCCLALVC